MVAGPIEVVTRWRTGSRRHGAIKSNAKAEQAPKRGDLESQPDDRSVCDPVVGASSQAPTVDWVPGVIIDDHRERSSVDLLRLR